MDARSHTSSLVQRAEISGDRRLSLAQRLLWLGFNVANNWTAAPRGGALPAFDFVLDAERQAALAAKCHDKSSPSRRLSDMFWMSLPWAEIARALGGRLDVAEIGCGSGYLGRLIAGYAPETDYTGCDLFAHPDWEKRTSERFRFRVADARNVADILRGRNLIVTQSALEHFEEDLTFFRQAAAEAEAHGAPLLQIHLMPSPACLWLYLWHGYRQYSHRRLEEIAALFGARAFAAAVALGAGRCNAVHARYITRPMLTGRPDRREAGTAAYVAELTAAIAADMARPDFARASFYALIVGSNLGGEIALPALVPSRSR
ncbi:class I SAM-dependent methyltransferase [Oleispirillum naphthae]|uniref:class I SAM-dependent methyltransferase n=1 Tax=Oleispirillum naphthae TaxID=2838853 RepID=UPI00308252C5